MMNWIEVIELRVASDISEQVSGKLISLINDINKVDKQHSVKLYSHVNINTDFSIHIEYRSEKIENTGSDIGQYISTSLKSFGLVNHNVWIKITDTEEEISR